jgi:hypothetical protein
MSLWWRGSDIANDLDGLPDSPRLGSMLIVGGVVLGLAPFAWPRIGPESFQRASASLFRWETQVPFLFSRYRRPEPYDLVEYLVLLAAGCLISGAFIFVRRRFVWSAADKDDAENLTQPDLK